MTFTEIVTEIKDRLNLTSSDSTTRIGREVNARYRRVTSAIGLQVARRVIGLSANTTMGVATLTFSGIEKIERIVDDRTTIKVLTEVTLDELRAENPDASDTPSKYAIQSMGSGSVTIRLDVLPQTVFALKADGLETASTLSGVQVPAFAESFHDILVEGVVADELRKQEKLSHAKAAEDVYERRLSELRMFIAKSGGLKLRQGGTGSSLGAVGGGGGGSAPTGGTSYTQTGLITFDRDPSAPFAVTAGSAKVDNLNADLLDGLEPAGIVALAGDVDGPASATDNAIARFDGTTGKLIQNSGITIADAASGTLAGSNSGDVTLAGSPDYLTLAGQVITRALINLASHVTSRLPFANFIAATAASRIVGRRSGSAGDFEEISLGSGLSMSGTTLSATVVAGNDTEVQYNNAGALAGAAGLTYSGGFINSSTQPRVNAYHNTTQTVNAGSTDALSLNSEDFDVGAMHDNASNNSRATVPASAGGVYLIVGHTRVALAAGTDGTARLNLRKNGTTVMKTATMDFASNSPEPVTFTVIDLLVLSATDYVELTLEAVTNNMTVGSATRSLSTTLIAVKLW